MRLSRLGTDSSLPPDYQGFRAASELGRSILAAGQPSSCRPTTDRGCKAAIQGAAPHRRIRRRDQGRAVGDESASRNRKFESTPLQRRVRLSPGAAFEGREPRLSARLCAAGLAIGSAETRRVLQDRANRRQYLCRAIFQYRSAADGGRECHPDPKKVGAFAELDRAVDRCARTELNQSPARSADRARQAAGVSDRGASLRSNRVAAAHRGSLG